MRVPSGDQTGDAPVTASSRAKLPSASNTTKWPAAAPEAVVTSSSPVGDQAGSWLLTGLPGRVTSLHPAPDAAPRHSR